MKTCFIVSYGLISICLLIFFQLVSCQKRRYTLTPHKSQRQNRFRQSRMPMMGGGNQRSFRSGRQPQRSMYESRSGISSPYGYSQSRNQRNYLNNKKRRKQKISDRYDNFLSSSIESHYDEDISHLDDSDEGPTNPLLKNYKNTVVVENKVPVPYKVEIEKPYFVEVIKHIKVPVPIKVPIKKYISYPVPKYITVPKYIKVPKYYPVPQYDHTKSNDHANETHDDSISKNFVGQADKSKQQDSSHLTLAELQNLMLSPQVSESPKKIK